MQQKSERRKLPANYYFDNDFVESLCRRYVLGGAVDIELRDTIMSHADELIENVIRVNNFVNIISNSDDTTFYELKHIAWKAIEQSLYKFNMTNEYRMIDGRKIKGQPIEENNQFIIIEDEKKKIRKLRKIHLKRTQRFHTKVFGMWSQISKTAILAYIKKDKRNSKNKPHYTEFLINKYKTIRNYPVQVEEFIIKAKGIMPDNVSHRILDGIVKIYQEFSEFPRTYEKELSIITKIKPKIIKRFFETLREYEDLFQKFLNNIEINKVNYEDPFNENE